MGLVLSLAPMKFWLLLTGYAAADLLAAVASVHWLKRDSAWCLWTAFIAYTICTLCWLASLRMPDSPGFTRAMAVYPLWAMLVGVSTGFVVSGERIGTRAWLGVLLGVVALTLIATDERPD
jgi:drug/metabolite transporter (DMT)-like permease